MGARLAVAVLVSAASTAAPTASIGPAPNWIVKRVGATEPGLVVAVTSRDAAVLRPFALFGSFKRLSRSGVLVWVATLGRDRPHFPRRAQWPPHLASFNVQRGFEGQPAPNIQQRVWVGSVRGWDLDVRVYFATQHPGARLRALAQAELRRLRLP